MGSTKPTIDLYISVDVETDGPIPGEQAYSMVAIGACIAGQYDGHTFTRIDPDDTGFHAVLKPISDNSNPDALAISGLTLDHLKTHGETPQEAMDRFRTWIDQMTSQYGGRPVFAGYPAVFDWLFTYWYLARYGNQRSPFGFSACYDMKTAYAVKTGTPITAVSKRTIGRKLTGNRAHTHNPLDDARGQADLLANLFGIQGNPAARTLSQPKH